MGIGGFDGEVRVVGTFIDKISGKMKAIQGKAANLGSKLMTMGSRVRSAGQSLTIGLTTPIVAAGFAIVKTSLKFGDSMAQIIALSEASAEQVAEWREEILRLAPEVAKSPQELADAMLFLASAGLKAGTEIEVLEIAAKASATGLGETKEIAKALTNVLNAYGQENVDAAGTAGILIEAVKQGTVEVDEMGEVIGRALPLASELGISFDELAAAQAALSLINADAAENMTSFMGIMRGIILPSDRAKALLKGMGKTFADLRDELKTKGLISTLQDLREGLTIDEIATLFPKVRGLTGLLNLTGESAEDVDAIFRKVANAGAPDLEKAFEDIQTPGFQMRKAMAQLQVVMILLGDVLVPMIADFLPKLIRWIAKGAEVFSNLPGPVQKAIVIFFALLAALGPVLIVVGALIAAVGGIMVTFSITLGTVLLFASGIGLVIAAIVLLVIGIFFLVKNWDKVKEMLLGIGETIADFFTKTLPKKFGEFKDKAIAVIKDFAGDMLDEIMAGLGFVLSFLGGWASKLGTMLAEEFKGFIEPAVLFGQELAATFMFYLNNVVLPVIRFFWPIVQAIFKFALDRIILALKLALRFYRAIFVTGFTLVFAVIKFYWALFVLTFKIAMLVITTAFGVWWAITSQMFSSGMKVIWAIIKFVWALIKNVYVIIFATIVGLITTFLALIRGDWGAAWDALKLMFSTIWDAIKEIVFAGLHLIQVFLTEAWENIKTGASEIWGGIKDVILDSLTTIKDEGATIINAFIEIIESGLNAVLVGINGFTEGINDIAGALGLHKIGIGSIPTIPDVKLPRIDIGGDIVRTGLAIVHKGERVLTADFVKNQERHRSQGNSLNVTINFNAPVTADDGEFIAESVKGALREHVLRFGGAT